MMTYWVTTEAGYRLGPYDSYADAFFAASINFGLEGWTISSKQE